MFPILLFYILKCKQDSLNLQIALRYGSRNRMFRSLLLESGIYAVTISAVMVLLESIIGYYFLGNWMNWNDASSKFYMNTGVVSNIHFLEIAVTVWVMYILKFLPVGDGYEKSNYVSSEFSGTTEKILYCYITHYH